METKSLPELFGEHGERRDHDAAQDPGKQRLVPHPQTDKKEAGGKKSTPAFLMEANQAEQGGNQKKMLQSNRSPVEAGGQQEERIARQEHARRSGGPGTGNPAHQAPEQPDGRGSYKNHRDTGRQGGWSPASEE